jgi:hypothetical protein
MSLRKARAFFHRAAGLFGRARRDRDLDAELRSHLELAEDEGVRAGLAPAEARRRAVLRLGGV